MPYEMVRLLNSDHPYRYDGTLFGGTKLWTPRELTTALWLDADSPSSITLNGATVSQWNDKSGNGRHATQATAANQPTYTANGLNGKPVLTFDGSNDELNFSATRNSLYSVATIVKTNLGESGYFQFGAVNTYGSMFAEAGPSYRARGPAFTDAVAPFIAGETAILVGTYGTTSNIWKNGTQGTPASSSLDPMPPNTTSAIGSLNGTYFLNGLMGEIVVANENLSTDNRQKLEGYLAWKWGTQASLPVSHPYYSAPPLV
jgi:hypothetical protein